MLRLSSDIPFSREDANRFLPWVVGLMVCLAGLFLCAALSVHQSSDASGRLNVNSFQIYVPHDYEHKAELKQRIIETLTASGKVQRVEELPPSQLAKLVSPWTGGGIDLASLPLPLVLEVTLGNQANRMETVPALTASLQALDHAVEVESYQRWVDQLLQFTGMLRLLAIVLALLVVGGLVVMVVIAARTSLKLHFKAVQLLHLIGAQDDYIVRQFVSNATLTTLRGAVAGAVFAAALFGLVAWFSQSLQSPLLPSIELLPLHGALLLLLPCFSALVAYIAVRASVQAMIEGMH